MERSDDAAVMHCHFSGDEIKQGERAWCLEESMMGRTGFIPLPDRRDWLVFSSKENLIAHHIPADHRVCNGGSTNDAYLASDFGSTTTWCDNGACPFRYGMRALRVQQGQLDGIGFVAQDHHDATFFCSKACLDEYFRHPELGGS